MSYLPRLHEPINRFGSPGVLSTVVEFKGERQCSISVEHSSMTPACRDCRVRVLRDAYPSRHAAREGLGGPSILRAVWTALPSDTAWEGRQLSSVHGLGCYPVPGVRQYLTEVKPYLTATSTAPREKPPGRGPAPQQQLGRQHGKDYLGSLTSESPTPSLLEPLTRSAFRK